MFQTGWQPLKVVASPDGSWLLLKYLPLEPRWTVKLAKQVTACLYFEAGSINVGPVAGSNRFCIAIGTHMSASVYECFSSDCITPMSEKWHGPRSPTHSGSTRLEIEVRS